MGLSNLKFHMKQKGLQSKELADLMGVRAETISRWITGAHSPGIDQAEQLAEVLGVSMSDILVRNLKGMRINGTRDYNGWVTFYDSMKEQEYLPMPGQDTPTHRFCLKVITHLPEDQFSYDTFSDVHIKRKEVSSSSYAMRSLVKINEPKHPQNNKLVVGVVFPMPINGDGKQKYTLQHLDGSPSFETITSVGLHFATPMMGRLFNRNQSEVLDLVDQNNEM